MNDELAKLLEVKWRGISFPIKNIDLEMNQTHAIHVYPDRDGARVEATGRNARTLSGTAIFTNHIQPGSNESWTKGTLFPSVFRKFMDAMEDRSTGEFQHPLLGKMFCKAVSAKYSLNADFRGGATVDFQFIETIDDSQVGNLSTSSISQLGEMSSLASNLDKSIPNIKALAKIKTTPTLLSSVRALQGIFDKPALLAKKGIGQIDSIKHRCNEILGVLKKANDVSHGKIIADTTALKVNTEELKKQLLSKDKPKSVYVAKSDTSLTQLASLLGATLDDLMKLNPDLIKTALIARGTLVRYYKV